MNKLLVKQNISPIATGHLRSKQGPTCSFGRSIFGGPYSKLPLSICFQICHVWSYNGTNLQVPFHTPATTAPSFNPSQMSNKCIQCELSVHLLRHQAICRHCSSIKYLRRHLRTTTGEKPKKCSSFVAAI